MGRRASIKPNRSIYSVEELTELYKKEKNTRMQKRLLAVEMMVEEDDISSYDVASRLSTSPTSIRDWVNKYNKGGYEALKEKGPRGGKPRISDEEFLKIIEEIPLGDPRWTLKRIAVLIQQRHKDGIKKSAVWYRLKKMGIHGRVAGHTIPRQTKRSKKHLKKKG
jgi:transposase